MGRIYLNNDWQFIPEFSDEIKNMDCTLELENVRIPHTTKEVPFNCFDESVYQMLCGYRRIAGWRKFQFQGGKSSSW